VPVRVSDLRGEKNSPFVPRSESQGFREISRKGQAGRRPFGGEPNLGERKTLRLGGLETERLRVFKGERGAAKREALWQAPGGESLGGLKAQESTGSASD